MAKVSAATVDVAVAVALSWFAASAALDPPGPAFTGPAWVAWLAGAAVGLPLAARRRWPLPVLAVVLLCTAVVTAAGVAGIGVVATMWAPVALAAYTVAASARLPTASGALAAALAAPAATIPWLYRHTVITTADQQASEVPLWWQVELGVVAVMVTAAWAAGRVVRSRRLARADADQRLARDAMMSERLRIARELHDIVGHSMSLIAVKATIANHIAEQRPAETRAALVTIEQTSRAALTEIRRVLDVLRDDDPAAELGPVAHLAPVAGTADLESLAEPLRSAGLRVDLRADTPDPLPSSVGLTVYRIVQESLTNVLRHANAGRCEVIVASHDHGVLVEIIDDGRGTPASGRQRTGRGLIGMRERVAAFGGTLSAGPLQEGGFKIKAQIPYAESPSAQATGAAGE
ncbi:signal transduction histidine kinase [Actinoplanes lutulentus]|uniref:histidine kinase n=1 Tax=Actinoplanes lutulentus TaxID=1287878 RepID=A0A327Z5S4_9ACTN|nr:sensor histidine kinase [Actinoplanes lutulentus]MBB2947007.1 signal transduction histidine kinase [Actinoplanes lutulentus]RAK30508.1 signal transduction histidine kinase [Actinoplanes lutulentus]